jgi:hypothetical protein
MDGQVDYDDWLQLMVFVRYDKFDFLWLVLVNGIRDG